MPSGTHAAFEARQESAFDAPTVSAKHVASTAAELLYVLLTCCCVELLFYKNCSIMKYALPPPQRLSTNFWMKGVVAPAKANRGHSIVSFKPNASTTFATLGSIRVMSKPRS